MGEESERQGMTHENSDVSQTQAQGQDDRWSW